MTAKKRPTLNTRRPRPAAVPRRPAANTPEVSPEVPLATAPVMRGVRLGVPASWRVVYVWQQLVVLLLMGPAFAVALAGSSVFEAAFVHLPTLDTPLGISLSPALYLPLLAPVLLGIPLALSSYRAPLLLWISVITVALLLSVFELSRLNWFAFFSGVAFRLEGGPVPMARTIAGLITLLLALLVLAQQSLRRTVLDLAERGATVDELRRVRDGLVGIERAVLAAAAGAGVLLAVVAAISLRVTEGAPKEGAGIALPLLWAAGLIVAILVALAFSLWDFRRRA